MSFVVIAHNEQAGITRALQSILAQDHPGEREILVVDDGSSDKTAAVVTAAASAHPEIQLHRLDRNRGRGHARMVGINAARGDYIATVDADIILGQDWLARCLDALPEHDAVGGTAVPDGDVAYLGARFRLAPRVRPHTTVVTGSNALYRREVFARARFDPALRDGEDVAFNHELTRLAVRATTLPGLTVRHEESKAFPEALRWMFQSGRGAARQLYRYRRPRGPDIVFAGWLVSLLIGAGGRSRVWRVLPGAYVLAAAGAHVGRAFTLSPRQALRGGAAILTDSLLLSSYFSGRLVGTVLEARPR